MSEIIYTINEIAGPIKQNGDFWKIAISDNGIGFPAENRQRLLEPYMTTRAEGTGLGLPIVAKIFEDPEILSLIAVS